MKAKQAEERVSLTLYMLIIVYLEYEWDFENAW